MRQQTRLDAAIPVLITVFAGVVGLCRWLIAGLMLEGIQLPAGWDFGIQLISSTSYLLMAVVEAATAVYAAYVISIVGKSSKLSWLLGATILLFLMFIAPPLGAKAAGLKIEQVLTGWLFWTWVSAATLVPFAMVAVTTSAYAEKLAHERRELESGETSKLREQVSQLAAWNKQWQEAEVAWRLEKAHLESQLQAAQPKIELCPICFERGKEVPDSPAHRGGHATQAKRGNGNHHGHENALKLPVLEAV